MADRDTDGGRQHSLGAYLVLPGLDRDHRLDQEGMDHALGSRAIRILYRYGCRSIYHISDFIFLFKRLPEILTQENICSEPKKTLSLREKILQSLKQFLELVVYPLHLVLRLIARFLLMLAIAVTFLILPVTLILILIYIIRKIHKPLSDRLQPNDETSANKVIFKGTPENTAVEDGRCEILLLKIRLRNTAVEDTVRNTAVEDTMRNTAVEDGAKYCC